VRILLTRKHVRVHVICELLAVKHGNFRLDLFRNSVLDAFIEFFYVGLLLTFYYIFLFTAAYLCVLCTIVIINNMRKWPYVAYIRSYFIVILRSQKTVAINYTAFVIQSS